MNATNQTSFGRYKKYSTDLRRYYRMPLVQTSLSLVLSLFVCAFFILIAIRPTVVTIAKLNTTIGESEETLKKMNTKAADLQRISSTWDQIVPMITFVDNSIPQSGPNYKPLAKAMEIMAIESSVQLSSVNMGEALMYSSIMNPYTGNKRTVVGLPFSLRVTGEYPEITSFFTKLTNLDRVISIETIGFSKDTQIGDNATSVTFTLTGSASYLADESQLTNILTEKKDE